MRSWPRGHERIAFDWAYVLTQEFLRLVERYNLTMEDEQ